MTLGTRVFKWTLLGLAFATAVIHARGWGLVQANVKDASLPKVLLIGDSILGGYAHAAIRHLEGKASVDCYGNPYNQTNHSWHKDVSGILATNGPYAVVHFNLGLHGYRDGDIPEGQFEALTRQCVETIRQGAPGAKIVWAATTPVVTDSTPFALHADINPVIVAHNAMADTVMGEYGILINDLYALMVAHLDLSHGDCFHWSGAGYALMGEAVAKAVSEQLDRGTSP